MNFVQDRYKFFIFILQVNLFFQISCSEKSATSGSEFEINHEIDNEQWGEFLRTIDYSTTNLNNKVLLIVPSMNCMSCIQELDYWDQLSKETDGNEISLIVVEKYESRFRNFINNNNLSITAYRDSTTYLLENNYIPVIPVKVYFDQDGEVKRIHSIGYDANLEDFVADFKSKK